MNWIKVSEKLPKNKQEVLTVYYDDGIEDYQYDIMTYFKKGEVVDYKINKDIESPELRALDSIFNPKNEIKVMQDGFYYFESGFGEDGEWRKLDCMTHWMSLPEFKEE